MANERTKLDEIVASFSTLEDPRSHINRKHPLPSILVIAVLAVLAGAAGPTAIARWAKLKEELLTGILDLPNGIPGKDVFRRVLMTLRPEAFEAGFNAWIARLRDEAIAETGVERPIISLDGKTARGSHDARNELGPLHVVTAWAGEYGLALGQQVCEEKSNEITAIPELLRKIDVRGGVVTIDAMGAQKAIAEEVIRGKADYVLALKANHESLHRAVIEHIDERLEGDLKGAEELTTTDRGHGREEERTYLQLPVPKDLPGRGDWKGLKSVGVVTSRRDGGSGESRGPLLPVQPAGGRRSVLAGGARPLVGGERVPLEPRCDVPRGRLAGSGAGAGLEHHLAVPLHAVDPQAASRPANEPDHEAPRLRLVRRVPDGSDWCVNMLVCAGPARWRWRRIGGTSMRSGGGGRPGASVSVRWRS